MSDNPPIEPLFVRLYLDRHVNTRLAHDLRSRGFDVLTTQEAGKDTAFDDEQLLFASEQRRAIMTFNTGDFAILHAEWQREGRVHAGIIVSRQLGGRQYGLLLQRTLRFLNHFTSDEMIGNYVHLEQFK
jgi:predicted nuclease of predicted toxin-antitoxin system